MFVGWGGLQLLPHAAKHHVHFSITETKPHSFSSLVRHASVVGGISQEMKIAECFTLWLVVEWDLVCITIIEGALFQVSAAQSSLESNLQL